MASEPESRKAALAVALWLASALLLLVVSGSLETIAVPDYLAQGVELPWVTEQWVALAGFLKTPPGVLLAFGVALVGTLPYWLGARSHDAAKAYLLGAAQVLSLVGLVVLAYGLPYLEGVGMGPARGNALLGVAVLSLVTTLSLAVTGVWAKHAFAQSRLAREESVAREVARAVVIAALPGALLALITVWVLAGTSTDLLPLLVPLPIAAGATVAGLSFLGAVYLRFTQSPAEAP